MNRNRRTRPTPAPSRAPLAAPKAGPRRSWAGAADGVVGGALRSTGRPLDARARAALEPRFGHDFSRVRVHTGPEAHAAAGAVGARAFTVGRDVVFGAGQYEPSAAGGQRLVAHELAHVVQQGGVEPASGAYELGEPSSAHERQADAAAARASAAVPVATSAGAAGGRGGLSPGRTVQRELLGGLLGGLGGAAVGAVGGALLGSLLGPIGTVVGGIVGGIAGLVGGAVVGDRATTAGRSLSGPEVEYAKDVFKDSIDYSKITVTRDSTFSTGAPRTIGNTIHLRSDWGHFVGDTTELTPAGRETLIHEMGHVWQYQNAGLAYIPLSLIAQLGAAVGGKSRNAAYDWKAAHASGTPWEQWNPEQQAEAIEDYNKLLRKSRGGTATVAEIAELATLAKYMENVWARRGGPTLGFDPPDATGVLQ